jgi:hypothetical protein
LPAEALTIDCRSKAHPTGNYGVGSVLPLVAAPRTKRNRRLHFPAFDDLCFSYLLQETAVMGTLSTSSWLENSVLDQIYAWEAYLLYPTEEAMSIKFNPDKELRLNSNGKFLDHWMDLNA